MVKLKTVVIAASLAFASGAKAQPNYQHFDGNKLYELSTKRAAGFEEGMFYGYVIAVYDARRASTKFCVPEGVRVEQVVDVVKGWLARNPAQRHRDADLLVYAAMIEAWPCLQNKKPDESPLDTQPPIRRY